MKPHEVAKINRANEAFIARFNDYLGPDWKLEYINRITPHLGGFLRMRKVQVLVDYKGYPRSIGLGNCVSDTELVLDNDKFKRALLYVDGECLLTVKEAFTKYTEIQEQHQQLQKELSNDNQPHKKGAVKI